MAFVVSSLPDYVQVNKEQLINQLVLGGDFVKRMTVQTGIKKDAYINYLATAPALQSGASCGFSASGDTTFTQRTIATAALKVNMSWCPQTLLGKYTEWKVRMSANPNAEALPFEQEIMANVISHLNEKRENLIFWGDPTNRSSDANLKWHNGLIALALADSSVIDVNISAGKSAYEAIKSVYLQIPGEVLGKAQIFVSPVVYRQFMMELVDRNYTHYNPGEGANEIMFPGTSTKVVAVQGLNIPSGDTYGYIIAADPAELIYGCDLESGIEDARVWFSDDDDLYKVKFLWNEGVQYMFGSHIVLGKHTTLTSPESLAAGIADIAAKQSSIATVLSDAHNSTKHSLNTTATA